LDLGGVSGFEQSAAAAPDPLAGVGDDSLQAAMPAYANQQSGGAVEFDRSVVIAMWIGGGAVVLVFLAIVLSSLFRGCGEAPSEPSGTDAQSDETAPAESKPADEEAETETEDAGPGPAESDADDGEPSPKEDRRKSSTKKTPRKPASKEQAQQPSGTTIELSAGAALAQTLPMGTAMGFSVDYEFADGQPDSSAKYVLVIKPANGQPVKQPVQLESRGTLQGFAQQLKPDDGPFQTHVEDQGGARLSESLALR